MTFLLFLIHWTLLGTRAETTSLPPAPSSFVLDETQSLVATQKQTFETLLEEHQKATGQRIWIAFLKHPAALENVTQKDFQAELSEYSHRIFALWTAPLLETEGKRAQTFSILLSLFPEHSIAFLEQGIGFEAQLIEIRTQEIIQTFVTPELQYLHPFRAVGLGVLEILKTIESPLYIQGLAQKQLIDSGLTEPFRPLPPPTPINYQLIQILLSLLLGLILILGVFYSISAKEAHYTREGWFHPLLPEVWIRLTQRKKNPPFEGGGSHGHW